MLNGIIFIVLCISDCFKQCSSRPDFFHKMRGGNNMQLKNDFVGHVNYQRCQHQEVNAYKKSGLNNLATDSDPWDVSIHLQRNWKSDHICSGVLVAPDWVLTAAHCLEYFSENQLIITTIGSQRNHIKIVQKKLHPNFNANTHANDVALLKLERPIEITTFIHPVCLLMAPHTNNPCNNDCKIGGFGKDPITGSHASIMPKEKCKQGYSERGITEFLTDDMVCVEDPTEMMKDCKGDSGASLICSTSNGMIHLVGLLSVGWNCAGGPTAGVFTEIYRYVGWINSHANSESYCTSKIIGPIMNPDLSINIYMKKKVEPEITTESMLLKNRTEVIGDPEYDRKFRFIIPLHKFDKVRASSFKGIHLTLRKKYNWLPED